MALFLPSEKGYGIALIIISVVLQTWSKVRVKNPA
jgi:hypothetical protein